MDIKIDTEAVCEQLKEEVLDQYPVLFCRIEPVAGEESHTFEVLIPETDAEFGLKINPDKTFEVVRVNPDAASKSLLEWALDYLNTRNFKRIVA